MPHSYLSNLKEILGRKSQRPNIELQQTLTNPANLGIASSIPKSTRFSTFESTGPGPGDYNLVSTTKSTKLFSSKSGRSFRKQNRCKFVIFLIPKLITMHSKRENEAKRFLHAEPEQPLYIRSPSQVWQKGVV